MSYTYGKAIKKPTQVDYFYISEDMQESIEGLRKWVTFNGEEFDKLFKIDGLTVRMRIAEGASYDIPANYYIFRSMDGEYDSLPEGDFNLTYNKIDDVR